VGPFWAVFYLTIICGLGAVGAIFFLSRRERYWVEYLGVGAVLGTGSLGFGLFLLGLVGIRPTRMTLTALGAIALFGAAVIVLKRRTAFPGVTPFAKNLGLVRGGASAILSLVLVLFLCVVGTYAMAFPLFEWDAFAIWGYKAKVIAADGIFPRPDYFTDVSLGYSHLDYPLMTPFLMAGVYGALGQVDDRLAKMFTVVLFLGLTCLVLAFARRRLNAPSALAVTVVVMGTPQMLRWAGSGYADIPLAAFFTGTVFCLVQWWEEADWRYCILGGVMAGFAAFTKNEGLVFGVLSCCVVIVPVFRNSQWRRRLAGAGLHLGSFLLLILPWIAWSAGIPRINEYYAAHLSVSELIEKADRLALIGGSYADSALSIEKYGLVWIVLLASAIFGWRAFFNRGTIMGWLLLVAQLTSYTLAFVVTPWDVGRHMAAALDRLLMHVLPLAGMLIGIHLSSIPGFRDS
jgi:4-amino-4-deoxy-L-arabinose transferase-like glycosyltransferase